MHNVDRTLQEYEGFGNELENGYSQENFEQQEFGQEMGQEFGNEFEFEFGNELEQGNQQELEMALELLEISNEQELNQFLGGLLSRAVGMAKNAAASFIKSPTGQALGKHLVSFAQQTLPRLAERAGGLGVDAFNSLARKKGAPQLPSGMKQAAQTYGGQLGGRAGNAIANRAKRIFNLELETLSPENQELEIARAYYRYANDLARRTYQTYRRNPRLTPRHISRRVIPATSRLYAPGLLSTYQGYNAQNDDPGQEQERGTWVRQNGTIVLYGV